MTPNAVRVRQNYWAILVAALACFCFEAVWYSLFMATWLNGTGRTVESIEQAGKAAGLSEWMMYGTAFVCAAVMATAISCITQLTGPQTAARGVKAGALLWLGFVATVWATEYVFEVRPLSLFAVNAGFWLVGMVVMGAVVGGWKKKEAGAAQDVRAGATAMKA
jgi:hypothetical protein